MINKKKEYMTFHVKKVFMQGNKMLLCKISNVKTPVNGTYLRAF